MIENLWILKYKVMVMLNICNLIKLKPISKNPQRFTTRVRMRRYGYRTLYLFLNVRMHTIAYQKIRTLIDKKNCVRCVRRTLSQVYIPH